VATDAELLGTKLKAGDKYIIIQYFEFKKMSEAGGRLFTCCKNLPLQVVWEIGCIIPYKLTSRLNSKVSTYVVNDSMHENLMANLSVVEDGEEVIVK